MKRPILRASFLSIKLSGSKFLTSAAMVQAKPVVSKPVICATPLLPASRFVQTSGLVLPTPQIRPIPVTTTLRLKLLLAAFRVCVDVVDGILDRLDLLGFFVGDLDIEGLLEGHHEFDGVEGVGAEVVHERRIGSNFAFIHAKLFHDDLLYLLIYCGHSRSSLCWRCDCHDYCFDAVLMLVDALSYRPASQLGRTDRVSARTYCFAILEFFSI